MTKKKEKEIEHLVDMVAYQSGYAAFPSGDNPYPTSAGLNNERYSFWMGWYDKKLEKYKDWPEWESKAKGPLEVDLTTRFNGDKKQDCGDDEPPETGDEFSRT